MAPELMVMSIAVALSVGVAIYAVAWVLWGVLRAFGRGFLWVFGLSDGGEGHGAEQPVARRVRVEGEPPGVGGARVCSNPDCGHVESRAARFCPRCGRRWM